MRRRWERSSKLRDEFIDDISLYLAYKRADARGAIGRPDVDKWLAILEKHYSEERGVLEFALRVINKERARASRERKEKTKARRVFQELSVAHPRVTQKQLCAALERQKVIVKPATLSNWITEFKNDDFP